MKLRQYILLITISMLFSMKGSGQSLRGMYINDFDVILGNTQKEDSLLSYLRDSSFNYMALYDLSSLNYSDANEMNTLSSFILKARQVYGIPYVGAVGETKSFFTNKIKGYNNSRLNAEEKFNVFNVEFEFWTTSSVEPGGYYCVNYLQPGGCDCDTAGAFGFYINLLKSVDSLAAAEGAISETYIGWFNQGQGQQIQSNVDRILLHAYRIDNSSVWSYSKNRLSYLAANNQTVNVAPIFSSEPIFMGPWIEDHSQLEAFDKYETDFNNENSSWKQYINLLGYQWFNYGFMPKTNGNGGNNPPSISASGATTFCQGGMVTLTATTGTAYHWSNGSTTSSINVVSGGTYSCEVTQSSITQTSNAIHVNVYNAPAVSVVVNNPVNNTVPLASNTDPGSGTISTYQWKLNNSAINGASTSTFVATESGDYTLVATNSFGCSNASAPAEVIVPVDACIMTVPMGMTSENITSNSAIIKWNALSPTDSIIIRYKQGTEPGYTYIRLAYNGQTSHQLTGLQPGKEYSWKIRTVCGSSTSNYSVTKYFTTLSLTAINELKQFPTDVMIYPNPATALTHITVTCSKSQVSSMTLIDLTGKTILTEQSRLSPGTNEFDMDVSKYNKGIYILSLKTERENILKRISVE